MKKCPTCEKTFDDALKFCQTDGTPLVDAEDKQPEDPYKTMVAGKNDLLSGISPQQSDSAAQDDDILDIDEPDLMKTMVSKPVNPASDENFSKETKLPTPPRDLSDADEQSNRRSDFGASDRSITNDETSVMNTGDAFDSGVNDYNSPPLPDQPSSSQSPYGNPSSPPIPSPFDSPIPEFKEAEIKAEAFNTSYAEEVDRHEPMQQSSWTPPPAPEPNWQNQPIGQNTPFQPPMNVSQGQNQTLAIVSLVCGIASLLCCTTLLPGIAALVTGYIARKNAAQNPDEYGGSGLALAGMITGGISVLFGLILLVLYVFTGVLAGIGNM